jgi:hypothetical protein
MHMGDTLRDLGDTLRLVLTLWWSKCWQATHRWEWLRGTED